MPNCRIETAAVDARLREGQVAVVPGFRDFRNRPCYDLGRAGPIRARLRLPPLSMRIGAIYTDGDGVYTCDPHRREGAETQHTYEEMLEMASRAQSTATRSVEMAMTTASTLRPLDLRGWGGTLVCDEDEIVEHQVVAELPTAGQAKITLVGCRIDPAWPPLFSGPCGRERQCGHDRAEHCRRWRAHRYHVHRYQGRLIRTATLLNGLQTRSVTSHYRQIQCC